MTEKSLPRLDWRVVFNRAAPPGVRNWGRVRAAQLNEMGRVLAIAAWGQAHRPELRVVCIISPGNLPSIRVAEKAGFRLWQQTVYHDSPTLVFTR